MNNEGFTLVEVMVAMAVGLLVIGLVLVSFITLSVSSGGDARYATMHAGIRNALDRMSRDIHAASAVTACTSTQQFTITTVTDSGPVTVRYYLMGGQIKRVSGGSDNVLATKVDSISITMYDDDGDVTANTAEASTLEVSLFTSNNIVRMSQTDGLRMRAALRNK